MESYALAVGPAAAWGGKENLMSTRTTILAASAAVFACAALAQGNTPDSGASKDMQQQMMGSMQKMQSMPMSGDMDKDFARMMREHHLSGIEMAKKELATGKNAEMKRMARKIMDSQKKEVAQFDKWLAAHP
jgi:uncharacterized protein (DUF305 family)